MKAAEIRMHSDYILVKPDPITEQKHRGLVLPQGEKKVFVGTVVSAGEGKVGEKEIPMTVKAGQKVGYNAYAETTLTIEGVQYGIINQPDVVFILESK